ncbi:uncharacterized protein K452DRAFT_314045 [Aplosporella prunicola CBS 121167]|uniref:Chitin biosynthesis protein n=1 Tax=Aplosporella prunicola CBS 121167 TaxID=1176127 RepID=A0A6A6AXT1_9PEZI|nr:uncharacterized protein K452DRAFT_314045 [Aplosporella prunicola CBS 121167]KAF2135371.1 hypothetical protein K452DRAFT_314045 [Aplosporella prunicola CBS 121167]
MLVSLTVGKVDAGVAVLLTDDKRLIEFPSILLPPDITSGSIVDITVARNTQSEAAAAQAFHTLQSKIFQTFGQHTPSAPVLRCRNATQTSVVLEWDPIQLATAELRSLSLYRNGSKAGSIPRPLDMQSTKISGLAVDTEYIFHLVLRTSAGTYSSERLAVRTHKMTDLSGITVTPGPMPAALRESLAQTINRIGAKMIDQVRIDTTHFICTEGRGPAWEKAVEMNVPIVVPDWVKGCEREGRIIGVRHYYINADPRLRQVGPSPTNQQHNVPSHGRSQSSQLMAGGSVRSPPMPSPRTEITPPTPEQQVARHSRSTSLAAVVNGQPPQIEEEAAPPPPPKDDQPAPAVSSPPPPAGEGHHQRQPSEPQAEEPPAQPNDDDAAAPPVVAPDAGNEADASGSESGGSDADTEKGDNDNLDVEKHQLKGTTFPNTPGIQHDHPLPSPSDAGSFQDVAL